MSTETKTILQTTWPRWAEFLHHHGLGSLAAWALEAAGPLALLGAQAFHFGEPLLRPGLSKETTESLLALLEDDEARQGFVETLREAGKS